MRKAIIFFLFGFYITQISAQVGGTSSFNSLKIPTNTKVLALGGIMTSNPEENVNLFVSNPALLKEVDRQISFQHSFYMADIHNSQLSYAHDLNKIGLLGFSLQYFNYGKFDSYDENGIYQGEFKAADYILTSGYAHQMGPFRFGANLKFAFSDIASFNASALLIDIGGLYEHPSANLTIGLVIKNAGFILSDYTESSDNTLPFDVQLGTTFKPEHMPFRFSLNLHHLTQGNISFENKNGEEVSAVDKFFRHVSFGTELLIGDHVQLLVGYNHLIRQELKLENRSAGAGLGYGIQFDISKFQFVYSRAHYAAGKAVNQLGIVVDIKEFIKKDI